MNYFTLFIGITLVIFFIFLRILIYFQDSKSLEITKGIITKIFIFNNIIFIFLVKGLKNFYSWKIK
jgi:hypothetical protein